MNMTFVHDPEKPEEVIRFFKSNLTQFRSLRRLIITRERTSIVDINGDKMVFEGLTYGDPALENLLRVNMVMFDAKTLHDPGVTAGGVKEFDLSAVYPWGHDRIL